MNILKFISLTTVILIITTAVILTKPVMHKPAVLEDAAFTLASLEKKTPVKEVKTDFPSPLPPAQKTVVQKPAPVVKRIVRIVKQEVPAPVQTVTVKQQPVQQKTQPVKTVTPEKTEVKLPVKTLEAANETVEIEKPVKLEVEQPVKVVTTPVNTAPLTEKEEIIAWNKWRSDLQNKVMRDAKINAPVGTTFYFSCTVDKFGNISNINTWSDNDYYTPLAKRVIKPVLSSYQNQPILKFPARTQRTITNVNGSFTMAFTDRYSTPADYSDYERIK